MKIPSGFYVYIWKRPDGTPFYVGKGKGNRGLGQRRAHNKFLQRTLNKIGWENVKVKFVACASEKKALALEIKLIARFGRRNFGGTLCNLTDGGEGFAGLIFTKAHLKNLSVSHLGQKTGFRKGHRHSAASIEKLSRAAKLQFSSPSARRKVRRFFLAPKMNSEIRRRAKAQWANPTSRTKLLTGMRTPEARAKFSAVWKGRKRSKATRKKMSAASKKKWRNSSFRKKWFATRAKRIY